MRQNDIKHSIAAKAASRHFSGSDYGKLAGHFGTTASSNLIFYPADYDHSSNTWGGGKPLSDYDPSPEQIVNWPLDTSAFLR